MKIKRFLSAVVVVLFVLMSVNLPVLAQGDGGTVLPEEAYTVSGSTITGVSAAYLASLSEEEKQNISLILPDTINGITITAIGKNAFKSSTNYKVVRVDFSNMTALQSIGEWAFYSNSLMQGTLEFPETLKTIANNAFYYCPALSGSLVLPDSVESIGTHSFDGCTNMKGTLTLSSSMKTIPDYAFYNAGFTGALTIPEGVKSIGASAFRQGNAYGGFSGKLVIPDSVETVGTVAFANQNQITDVQFSANMTAIPDSMFRYCKGLPSVLEIPEQIQKIGATAFAESSLVTVYLPKMKDQSNTAFIQGNSFNSCANLTAIVAHEEDYAVIKPLITVSAVQKKLTYEKEIQLKDANGNTLADSLLKLYNQQYGFVKQADATWTYDEKYQFPTVTADGKVYDGWAISASTKSPVKAATVVGDETVLYPIEKLGDPVITFSEGIDKVYDGQPATLSVTATHPKAVTIGQAKEGDVVFYYTWKWATIGSSPAVLQGFDKNEFDVTDVRMPDYPISLSVSVMACNVENKNGKLTAVGFQTVNHDFSVYLRQAEPTVTPIYEAEPELKNGLPEISLTEGDTAGTIAWDDGQTLEEGLHTYSWTFTPEANDAGSANYKTISGTAELDAWSIRKYSMQVSAGENGSALPQGITKVEEGKDFIIEFKPDAGYRVDSVLVDGEDYSDEVKENGLTLKEIQAAHTISVTFVKIQADEMEDVIASLPEIKDGETPTAKQAELILEAKRNYELLEAEGAVSAEAKQELYDLLTKLPQIQLDNASTITDAALLLDNMSAEDVEKLLEDPSATIRIVCQTEEREASKEEQALLASVEDVSFYGYYDIKVLKTITSQEGEETIELAELKTPVQLEFAIPSDLPKAEDGVRREFFMVRIHEENGEKTLEVLDNESTDPSKLVISSDRFSLYTLGYRDVPIKDDNGGTSSQPEENSKPQESAPESDIETSGSTSDSGESDTIKIEGTGTTPQTPRTGDHTNAVQLLALGFAALAGGIAILRKKKKQAERNQ